MKRKSCFLPLFAMACVIALSSCDKNDDPDPNKEKEIETHHYVYAANVDQSLFVTTLKGFEEGLQSNFEDALTLPSGHLFMEMYGGYLYLQSGSMYGQGGEQTLYKYLVDKRGRISKKPEASLTFKGAPNVVDIVFANKDKAYGVTSGTKGDLIIFNPTTMQETGKIALSKYAYKDNDPDGGNGIVRDGKLFLPLSQAKSMKEIYPIPAEVAVIDVATDKVEKIIKDDRVTSLGMIGHSNPVMDEEGNIYFNSGPRSAMWCQYAPGQGFKEGLLRIKKGETEFDKDFYIGLQETDGGELGSYGMYMIYGGKGNIYMFLYKNSLVKDPEDQTFIKNKSYVPYEVNVHTRKGRILPLPASCSWAANALIRVDNNIFFGEQTDTGIGFYKYDMKSGKGWDKPTVTTPMGAYKVISLNR